MPDLERLTFSPPVDKYRENIIKETDCVLFQNNPNPFNPSTKINYYLPKDDFINLEIFDIRGQKNKGAIFRSTECRLAFISMGREQMKMGMGVPSGCYFYILKSSQQILRNKLLFLK